MRRWLPWMGLPLLATLLLFLHRGVAPAMLADTDTVAILQGIRGNPDPFAWLRGDWPLGNHFYRPVSTFFFQLDNWLHPEWAAGFGLTNFFLAAACVWLLFWLLRECSAEPWQAGLASLIFGFAHITYQPVAWVREILFWLSLASLIGFFLRRSPGFLTVSLAFLGLWFFSTEFGPIYPLNYRMLGWIPGRTASVMTVFVLISMGTYARWERLGALRITKEPTSTDRPATKGTEAFAAPGPFHFGWLILGWIGLILALGAYEQAIMLPGALIGLAVLLRTQGLRVRWPLHLVNWAILIGYFVLRAQVMPKEVSGYQKQQFRDGPGVVLDILNYLFPAGNSFRTLGSMWSGDWLMFLVPGLWTTTIGILGCFAAYWIWAKDRDRWPIYGWSALALVSFLPMAWLNTFDHYHYWPMAMRAAAQVFILGALGRALINAVSPRAIQAPARPHPAPGSLLHP